MLIRLVTYDLATVEFRVRQYDAEDDTVQSIIMDVCDSLDGHAEFNISGFGQDCWPVDVRTDLAVFLEQLPAFFSDIRECGNGEIYLYEQGVERKLAFELKGAVFSVKCTSFGNWVPSHSVELISIDEIYIMLNEMRETFLESIRIIAPALLDHPWLQLWRVKSLKLP